MPNMAKVQLPLRHVLVGLALQLLPRRMFLHYQMTFLPDGGHDLLISIATLPLALQR
jgi:hypothetical protein